MIKSSMGGAAAIVLAGCGCTEAGCESSLKVVVASNADATHGAEAALANGQNIRCSVDAPTGSCGATRSADGKVTFTFLGAPSAMQLIKLYDRSGAVLSERMINPMIKLEQPNGEDCEPTCKSATVEL